jgi:electron transfer flavoprotein beta subunit
VEEILALEDGLLTAKRHIDGGVETVQAPLPLVLTVNGSAAPCRPRNAKLVMKYKRCLAPLEKPAEGLAYAEEYDKKPWLTLGQISCADVNADLAQCGLSGSPTKVKSIENIVFKAKESKVLTGSDEDIKGLMAELLANHTIG